MHLLISFIITALLALHQQALMVAANEPKIVKAVSQLFNALTSIDSQPKKYRYFKDKSIFMSQGQSNIIMFDTGVTDLSSFSAASSHHNLYQLIYRQELIRDEFGFEVLSDKKEPVNYVRVNGPKDTILGAVPYRTNELYQKLHEKTTAKEMVEAMSAWSEGLPFEVAALLERLVTWKSISLAGRLPSILKLSTKYPWMAKQLMQNPKIINWNQRGVKRADEPSLSPLEFSDLLMGMKRPHALTQHMSSDQAGNLLVVLLRESKFDAIFYLYQKPFFGQSKTLYDLLKPRFVNTFREIAKLPNWSARTFLANAPLSDLLNEAQAYSILQEVTDRKLILEENLKYVQKQVPTLLQKLTSERQNLFFELWKNKALNGENVKGLFLLPGVKQIFGNEYGELIHSLFKKNELFTKETAFALLKQEDSFSSIGAEKWSDIIRTVTKQSPSGEQFITKLLSPKVVSLVPGDVLADLLKNRLSKNNEEAIAILKVPGLVEKLPFKYKFEIYQDFMRNPVKDIDLLRAFAQTKFFPPDLWLHAFYQFLTKDEMSLAYAILGDEGIRSALKESSPDLERRMSFIFQSVFEAPSRAEKIHLIESEVKTDFSSLQSRIYKSLANPNFRKQKGFRVDNVLPSRTYQPQRRPSAPLRKISSAEKLSSLHSRIRIL